MTRDLHIAGDRRRPGVISSPPSQVTRSQTAINDSSRPASASLTAAALALLATALTAGCGSGADDLFCDGAGCGFSDQEWARIAALANLPPPPLDHSNAVDGVPTAIRLGQAFFFDPRFSGAATQVDALRRPAAVARAPQGQPINLSCAGCHNLARAGIDVASVPGNVSSGAGWTDVNALGVVNSAYQQLFFWNGRVDSLWALAAAVAESGTTMNGNRLHTAWVIADDYAASYNEVFAPLGFPLPLSGRSDQIAPILETTGARAGQCTLTATSSCPAPCRLVQGDPPSTVVGCWPRFPLQGRPGQVDGCQPGDTSEPFGDAWDCMDANDRDSVTRVLVNWAKAIAAFEGQLVSRDAPFDRFVKQGPSGDAISPAAQRGAHLFVGKAGCIDCHNTPLLSDGDFHNVGVPQAGPDVPTEADCPAGAAACDCVMGQKCLPWGALDGLARLRAPANKMLRTSKWSDFPGDTSRGAALTRQLGAALKGAWRTPSLRNVALTAPYMHDGVYATLEEVVAHYARGGEPGGVGVPAADIKPLLLSAGEQADLVAFLRSLTGPPLPADRAAAPPPAPAPAAPAPPPFTMPKGDPTCLGPCTQSALDGCPMTLPCTQSPAGATGARTICFGNGARAHVSGTRTSGMTYTVTQAGGGAVCLSLSTPMGPVLPPIMSAQFTAMSLGPVDDPFAMLNLTCGGMSQPVDLRAPACAGNSLNVLLRADILCGQDPSCQ